MSWQLSPHMTGPTINAKVSKTPNSFLRRFKYKISDPLKAISKTSSMKLGSRYNGFENSVSQSTHNGQYRSDD